MLHCIHFVYIHKHLMTINHATRKCYALYNLRSVLSLRLRVMPKPSRLLVKHNLHPIRQSLNHKHQARTHGSKTNAKTSWFNACSYWQVWQTAFEGNFTWNTCVVPADSVGPRLPARLPSVSKIRQRRNTPVSQPQIFSYPPGRYPWFRGVYKDQTEPQPLLVFSALGYYHASTHQRQCKDTILTIVWWCMYHLYPAPVKRDAA